MGLDTLSLIFFFFIFIYSVILHEIAHGYVAYLCGDDTPRLDGRLTLNPIPHIDPFMTILVPLIFYYANTGIIFGGAKPVRFNPANLRKWPRDFILVGLAGVTVNFIIAGALSLIINLARMPEEPLLSDRTIRVFYLAALMNIFLAVFNLVPIPPLDGSRAFRFLLPRHVREAYDRLESFGFVIIIALLYLRVIQLVVFPITYQIAGWMQLSI